MYKLSTYLNTGLPLGIWELGVFLSQFLVLNLIPWKENIVSYVHVHT